MVQKYTKNFIRNLFTTKNDIWALETTDYGLRSGVGSGSCFCGDNESENDKQRKKKLSISQKSCNFANPKCFEKQVIFIV